LYYHEIFLNFFINCKVYMFKSLTHIKNVFACPKHSNWEWTIFIFLKHLFFLPNVHLSFWKLERILPLMIRRAKGLQFMKIVFVTNLTHLVQKCFWPWTYGFWKCGLNKSSSYLCDRRHECIIYDIKSICSQNIFIFNM